MNTRHILLLVFALGGCASNPGHFSQERLETNIGYLDGKFRVCRENCPIPTPKEIDDSVPMNVLLISEMMKKSITPAPTPVAGVEKRGSEKDSTEPITTAHQHEVYFDFGMSRPNAEGESELRKFEESIRGLSNLKIELIGRTDSIGSMKFNRRLARKRAIHVAERIKALDSKSQIALSTDAHCCQRAPYDKNAPTFKKMRRVTIKYRQIVEEQMNK